LDYAPFLIPLMTMPSHAFFFRSKLSLRQQQMDDRRRKNMNNEYSRGGTSQQQVSDD